MNTRVGSYIDGKYVSQGCGNCKFWTEHKPRGTCSQLVQTTEGLFVNRVTFNDSVCDLHEDDDIKSYFTLHTNKSEEIGITGHYNERSIRKMKQHIEKVMKAKGWK